MPKVYAPPGVTTRQPYSTFYQVFVGKRPANAIPGGFRGEGGGLAGVAGAGGEMGGPGPPQPAFEEHTALSIVNIPDGTSNTILIVEAGKAVPWTKPEDLEYTADRPIPPLGGLFPQVFHAAFAYGSVARLRKDFDPQQLRFAITRDGGEQVDLDRLKAPFPMTGADLRTAAGYAAELAELKQKNAALEQKLGLAAIQAKQLRAQRKQLRAEREVLQERAGIIPKPGKDPDVDLLEEENKQLQEQLRRAEEDIKQLQKEIQHLKEEAEKQAAEKSRK
jgi:FtsZ-binding cell division protein ZapB